MSQVSYADLRQSLAHYMDKLVDGRVPIVVTRQGGKDNVVRSIRSADAELTEEHDLIESSAEA